MPPGWERKKFEDGDGLLSDAPSVYIDVVGWAGRQGPADPIAERYETLNRIRHRSSQWEYRQHGR